MGHPGAALVDGAGQAGERPLQHSGAVGRLRSIRHACLRVEYAEQVSNQGLHALGAVDGKGDELVGLGIELAA